MSTRPGRQWSLAMLATPNVIQKNRSGQQSSSAKKFGTGGLETAGAVVTRCGHDRVGGASPMLVMDPVRHLAIFPSCDDRSERPKQCSQNIQKNRSRARPRTWHALGGFRQCGTESQ